MSNEQSELLETIINFNRHHLLSDDMGMSAYQKNLNAQIQAVFKTSYPRLDRAIMACQKTGCKIDVLDYFSSHPHQTGDWGEWGAHVDKWLESHELYGLSKLAELDWAVHMCEREKNKPFNVASFHLLASEPPSELFFDTAPGFMMISSSFNLHQWYVDWSDNNRDIAYLEPKTCGRHDLLVYRQHWRANVIALSALEVQWLNLLQARQSIEKALDSMPESFDFSAWLNQALELGIICAIKKVP